MRIGIDVGGTHTDAVLVDGTRIVASCKELTSADVLSGVKAALHNLQEQVGILPPVDAVMLGTTQFTNAVVERRELAEVAAIRIGLPSGRGLPPGTGWPEDIREALGEGAYALPGGFLYDGRPLAPEDNAETERCIADIAAKGLANIAISSAFSPANAEPELRLAERILEAIPEARITLSHQVGRLGLLERENAAMLNASLKPFAVRVVEAFEGALQEFGITSPLFISQNDGTLMDAKFVRDFPALTFSSGPTNSLRGAARLTGIDDAIVVDIGGTTSDIGVLRGGFPRESNRAVDVGGVRTNFRMPDIMAIGLGGGSIVSEDGRTIGPQSVGHRLVTEALVFGGSTLTATDIVVAAGMADVGDASKVAQLAEVTVTNALATMRAMLEDNIRLMKPDKQPLPVVLVGGGAILAPKDLSGASQLLSPENSGVANAIGASIALVGGEAEIFADFRKEAREVALERAKDQARGVAVSAGGAQGTIRVTEIEETPIPYMDNGVTRIRVKVVGDLASLSTLEVQA
ncbi:hydantoinase/oxoprolinase family protein [uncultured Erythrobacter sp.]|uniref:hydantoinase/oxoprolinase family protein n=1 Tax=uncultured Erythrobacter sp. TaxID=263913 RepID=UPI00262AE994|nr:hydantoinase/oxoprolinase family protein [uncultured Erythrobacter sp.]